jgi:formate hydrogenlyase subunit 6/NADH:ubiquinone oxidoreductase subunit I
VVGLGFFAKGGRAYCNLLCPVGALDALANRLGMRFGRRVRVDGSRCDGCGACAKVCPTWAIQIGETARIDPLACLPCRECEVVCPTDAIAYRAPLAAVPAAALPAAAALQGKEGLDAGASA